MQSAQRFQPMYYIPPWLSSGSPTGDTSLEVFEEEVEQDVVEEPFREIEFQTESYITCPDCMRKYTGKKAYNEHIAVCQDDHNPDILRLDRRRGGRPPGKTSLLNGSMNGGNDDNIVIQNVLRGRSQSMPTPGNSDGVTVHDGDDEDLLDDITFEFEDVKPAKKSDNGRSTSIDDYLMQQNNAFSSLDSYECKVCHKVYFTKYGFKLHLRTHTGNKGYTCEICNKSFSQSGHLKDHRRIHTGEKPFTCELCGKKFAQNQNLKHHLRMHSGVRPYKCKSCEKAFFTKCELSSHERVHSGDTPFSCIRCGKAFAQLSSYKAHVKTHPDDGPIGCPCCQQEFNGHSTLLNHIRCHESGGPFNCNKCGASFLKKGSLHHHLKFHTHQDPEEKVDLVIDF